MDDEAADRGAQTRQVTATTDTGDLEHRSTQTVDAFDTDRAVGERARRNGTDGRGKSGAGRSKSSPGSVLRELPFLIVIALALALVIKAFLVQAFYIPSGSMENTLRVGDRVLVNKVVYHVRDIERGDVVVFNGLDSFTPEVQVSEPTNPVTRVLRSLASGLGVGPPGERDFIKRVIGVPGDRVRCCDEDGRVRVNGVALREPYLFPGDRPSDVDFDTVVPQGRLWVMGDHRSASSDSRSHQGDPGGGTVPIDKVIGRAFVIVWPLRHVDTLPIPETFQQRGLAAAALGATPMALGIVGAFPVVAIRRRLRRRGACR